MEPDAFTEHESTCQRSRLPLKVKVTIRGQMMSQFFTADDDIIERWKGYELWDGTKFDSSDMLT